jgi:carboxylesterase type B
MNKHRSLIEAIAILIITFNHFHDIHAIMGGYRAKIPPYDDPVVFINHVGRYSRVEGYFNSVSNLYTFRGIRYADPPLRENRFLRPRLRRLKGDVDAKFNAPPCPQPDYYDERKIIGNEDCLALNIFTPQMPDETTGLPVILWIHGGGYRYGSAAQYGADPITQQKVVVVAIQYRLGTLGLVGDGSKEFGGNVAMFDMHAALQWVTQYISFFGGDKNRITAMGHGSGASSAMFLSQSPLGRSSIDGVIAMSGSSMNKFSYVDDGKNATVEIANAHNCSYQSEIELIKCLRSKTTEELILNDSKLQIEQHQERNVFKSLSGMSSFTPNIETEDDDRGLPGMIVEKPEKTLADETKFNKIPLLIGTTKHETANSIDVNEIIKEFKSVNEFLKFSAKSLKFYDILNAPKKANVFLDSLSKHLIS